MKTAAGALWRPSSRTALSVGSLKAAGANELKTGPPRAFQIHAVDARESHASTHSNSHSTAEGEGPFEIENKDGARLERLALTAFTKMKTMASVRRNYALCESQVKKKRQNKVECEERE